MGESRKSTRPPLITFLCSLVFVAGIYMIIQTFAGAFSFSGTLFSPFIVLFIIVALTGASGIWEMERWGFVVYMIAACGFQVIPIVFGVWNYLWLIPMALLFLFAVHVREMK